MQAKKHQIDIKLTISSFAAVLLLGIVAVIAPEATKSTMGDMLSFTITNLGSAFLWYVVIGSLILCYLAFTKYGSIRLGGAVPKFSHYKLFAMALCAGMGASTMYWGYMESIYYYMDPQFGIVDEAMKMEYATAFNIFHWGASGWFIYLMVAVPFGITFYIKKRRNLNLSAVLNSFFDDRLPVWFMKVIDLLFIITTLAATALTLGLGIPMISYNMGVLTGLPDNLFTGIGIIVGLSIVFSMSSYIGIDKGMSRMSDATIYLCILLLALTFLVGPSALIANNVTNGVGIMLTEFIRMSLNTDPYGNTLFPQYWTIFFWANWISYAPGVGVFITKIAQGHKLRDVILTLVIGGTIGSALIFGIAGTYTMNLMADGTIDAVGLISAGEATKLVSTVLGTMPFPSLMTALYLLTLILFCVTTLDGTSYSLTGIVTKNLDSEANVSPMFRVFWCLLLTVIPIVFLLINAQLNILKSFPVLIVVPLMPILLVLCFKATQYVRTTFGDMSAEEIERYTIQLAEEDKV
ncbi:BCCT family transporter [Pseudovibrio sp. Tun.PSC04-5.I4]|uniref:BCCT family transporter n=1 Tax=Pseudovibrio sp. Tun.PSC04-5.I4 TaxID=1798213 RepID=UPI000883BAAD|nr:BCCT family transporter [Pseudovibrio sp. Tun.PSC04-5.I4]SDR10821.1 betaine/carnitine transporter, BCCT family [Pseudovibrio sp. Tun.PSC04-5.I4]